VEGQCQVVHGAAANGNKVNFHISKMGLKPA